MFRNLAWSRWQLFARSLWPLPTARQLAPVGPVSAEEWALAVQVARRLVGWLHPLCLERVRLGRPGGQPGRRARLADEQALRPFRAGALAGWSSAQAEQFLTGELERLVWLLEAPLMQFHHERRSNGWESARWTVLICLVRLGQVAAQAARAQGQAQGQRVWEAAMLAAHGRLVGQGLAGRAA